VNWGGRSMENARPGEPTTDWGAVDPTQNNVAGYFNLKPGPKYLDAVESPRNCNWYLLTLGCRRGLTFLERQPEVDPQRLGIYGHSMGGNLTTYVAGTDDRVRVAVPSVGGQGYRTFPRRYLPRKRPRTINGGLELFRGTMAYESYAPLIRCPFLHLGATNDFHGIMDDVYRTNELIPHGNVRCSFAPHLNHRFGPSQAVTRPLWIDQHLRNTFTFPDTPATRLLLKTDSGIPALAVEPDRSQEIATVDIYYSIDPDPRARFWRDAMAERSGSAWNASLPVMDVGQPLFAFANVYYRLEKPEKLPHGRTAESFCVSSKLHVASPIMLRQSGVKATDKPSLLIDDFKRGFHDWYLLEKGNPHHWQYWTRKITDRKWRGPAGARLSLELKVAEDNTLVFVAIENEWRRYRGRKRTYVAMRDLKGTDRPQAVRLACGDFTETPGGSKLGSWEQLDQLGLRAYCEVRTAGKTKLLGSKRWRGPPPELRELRWVK
jgi:hypothetical protein